jgi:flagella basal body P-ring formation protein FlgA
MRAVRHLQAAWRVACIAASAVVLLVLVALPVRAAELVLPVPRATIYPGDVIGEDQLVDRAFIAHTVARATIHEAREGVIGKVARRTLLPGQPITLTSIREPYLVTQGKSVLVIFESGGLTITTNAMALQNGSLGEVIALRNVDSGTIIRGTVASDGTVRLTGP